MAIEPVSQLKLIQQAEVLLGVSPQQELDDDTDIATTAITLYEQVRDTVLTHHPWDFSMKRAQLSRSTTDPAFGWKYAYVIPDDLFGPGPREVYNTAAQNAAPINDFILEGSGETDGGSVLLTDEEQILLRRRIAEITEGDEDALFGDGVFEAALSGEVRSYDPSTGNYDQAWLVERKVHNRTSQIIDPPDGRFPRERRSTMSTSRNASEDLIRPVCIFPYCGLIVCI